MNLDTKIDICIKVEEDSPVENLEPSYTHVIRNIWAKKIQLLGRESIKLGLEHNTTQVNFITRKRDGVTDGMYIVHNGVIYNIYGVQTHKDDKNYMLIATVRKQELV